MNKGRNITHWSNDGTSLGASEPTAAVPIPVVDGVFNAVIGDASLENMTELDSAVFNAERPLFLRVWFSDGELGFESLEPDKKITNQDILGIIASDALDVYVDPATGDDAYSGLEPSQPKRTIQAA